MNLEQKIIAEQKEKPDIQIIKGSDAPELSKKNPFYNPYHWAMVDWADNKLYLPDKSDEAISFSIAAHELGHLIKEGRIQPSKSEFDPTLKEEIRAWQAGWKYLEKYLPEYYGHDISVIEDLSVIKLEIEKMLMKITILSKPFYEIDGSDIQDQRMEFSNSETGAIIKTAIGNLKIDVEAMMNELKMDRYLKQIDWDKFCGIIKKALIDIEKDNQIKDAK